MIAIKPTVRQTNHLTLLSVRGSTKLMVARFYRFNRNWRCIWQQTSPGE